MPASQLMIGIGNYGYDWNNASSSVDVIGFQDALDQSSASKTPVALQAGLPNPNFTYTAKNQEHQVWYLDAVTAFNQLVDAQGFVPRGYALWVLGSEDPGVWQVFDHRNQLDQTVTALLQTMKAGYGAAYSQPGKRSIAYDPTKGLITSEQILAYPSP